MAEIDILSINNKKIQDVEARKDIQIIKENQINLIEDDTSMEGISDTTHDNLETTNKTIIGGINEVNSQLKDIANKTVIEGNKLYLVKSDGTKIDNGTTLPTSTGTVTSNSIETYKCEDIGELYPALSNYTAWCPCDLHFDKSLSKYVVLIYCAPSHVHSNADLYVTYINKDSYIATEPVKCKYVDSDGVTDITPSVAGACSYIILNDGTYLMIHKASDNTIRRFISEDNGKIWKSTNILTNVFDHPWQIKELSNGRIICSDDSSKVGFMYSDDKGITWTHIVPVTCGGGYEGESCILELEEGKLIAIGRYSMSGKGYYESGDSEHAIISYSNDNGTTWAPWQISNSIDNMNASSCTGIVHDGIIEIFACSRWYSNGSNINTDKANTGKNGAMTHYVATIENALKDNFSKVGIIDYARGEGGEYHSPCVAVDDNNNILIVHMDGGSSTTCNHRYIRGQLGNLSYIANNNSKAFGKAYTANYTEKIINDLKSDMNDKIGNLQYIISQIAGSGVKPPSDTMILTNKYIANDSQPSELYPWQEGSDFYNMIQAVYPTQTGSGKVNEFINIGEEYVLKTYSLIFKKTLDSNCKNCSFVYNRYEENGYSYYHYVKDGYITVIESLGNHQLHNVNGELISKSTVPNECVIELGDGYCKINDKKYEVPKMKLTDYIALENNSNFKAHCQIANYTLSASTFDDTTNHIGAYLSGYCKIKSLKVYESF